MLSRILIFAGIALIGAGNTNAACPDYALVVARGTGEPQGPSGAFSGQGIVGMVNKTFTAVPNGIEYDVKYPADFSFTTSENTGRDDAIQYITNARNACPRQKFALLGYSQGAAVVLRVLQQFGQNNDFINAVVLLGNPYQKKGQISTVDENGGDTTRNKNGALYSIEPNVALSDTLDKSGKVLNICYTRDLVCTGFALDTFGVGHGLYGFTPSVQTLGANLLISKLR